MSPGWSSRDGGAGGHSSNCSSNKQDSSGVKSSSPSGRKRYWVDSRQEQQEEDGPTEQQTAAAPSSFEQQPQPSRQRKQLLLPQLLPLSHLQQGQGGKWPGQDLCHSVHSFLQRPRPAKELHSQSGAVTCRGRNTLTGLFLTSVRLVLYETRTLTQRKENVLEKLLYASAAPRKQSHVSVPEML